MSQYDFDLITIGGGSGGVRASRFAANLGAKVAVVEGSHMGGTCVNVGCIPKKLMSVAAHYHEDFDDAAGFGWHLKDKPAFDWPTLIARKDTEIARLNRAYENVLATAGVTTLEDDTLSDRLESLRSATTRASPIPSSGSSPALTSTP